MELNFRPRSSDKDLFYLKRTTIASFPGGKSDRNKHQYLFRTVPDKINYLIEPFAGLANFFIVISPRVSQVWLNDKDPEIFSLLQCLKYENLLKDLIEFVKSLEPIEKEQYYNWKVLETKNTVSLAVRRLIILNCSVNGAGGGYSFEKSHRKWYQNKPNVWMEIHSLFKEKQAKITNMDFSEVLKQIRQVEDQKEPFIYLDPPYDSVAHQGKLYGKNYNLIDWNLLKNDLLNIKSHWILSNRDNSNIRRIFSNFHQYGYNTYNDMNNKRNTNPELLISNKKFT